MPRPLLRTLFLLGSVCVPLNVFAAAAPDYDVADPLLKVIRLDSAPTESFLAIKADTTGRLFVGGREALFVYEPNDQGGYHPRQQLLTFPDHTWVYDIEIRGDDLYILTVSALYLIPDARIQRDGLEVRRLIWGVPLGHVHQCFHGMTWGPEGDLYFAMGDPLWYYGDFNRPDHWGHWTFFSRKGTRANQRAGVERGRNATGQAKRPPLPPLAKGGRNGAAKGGSAGMCAETDQSSQYLSLRVGPSARTKKAANGNDDGAAEDWEKTPYNGVGGVFRCKPDGSGFQVVARGLRNSCGLAFDRDWNLFTNDNDHESMPAEYVPGRLNHVTPHSDFSWPRGWMLTKTPDRMDLLDTMNTALGRFVPVGQAYYDDTYLPEKYRNSLLVARWCTRQITFYPLEHHGATFHCDEHELLSGRDLARPVHVTVGRGGRIFASICYMAHNEGSPVYKSDLVMITRADDADDHPFEAYDAPTATTEKLFEELSNDSWSRRKEAHIEILRRGSDVGQDAPARILTVDLADKSVPHLVWIGAATIEPASIFQRMSILWTAQFGLLNEPRRADVRLQATRALAEFGLQYASESHFVNALYDDDPLVRHAGLIAGFRKFETIPEAVMHGFVRSRDTYLRQSATRLLAEKSSIDALATMTQSDDPLTRLAAVLAAGFRLTLPPATGTLSDDLPLAPWRNSDEAYIIQYIDEKVDLRDYGRLGTYTVADHWRAGKHSEEQEQLFLLLAARLPDLDDNVRLQAAHFLYLLNDERAEPVIAVLRAAIHQNRLGTAPITAVAAAWAIGPFDDEAIGGWNKRHDFETRPFDPTTTYPIGAAKSLSWTKIKSINARYFDFRQDFKASLGTSCYLFLRIESGTKQRIELLVGSDSSYKIALNGSPVAASESQRSALPIQDVVALDLQPGSNDLLVRVRGSVGDCRLYLHTRSLQPVAIDLPEALTGGTLAERLKEAAANPDQTKLDPRFLDVNWDEAIQGGDVESGKKLFSASGLGCAKCHAETAESAVTGGPSLADAVKRFTVAHLVESVLLPNKTISPVFKATTIVTKEGKTFTGLVIGETGEKLEMILTDTNRVTIATTDIDDRVLQNISPMPAGLVKTPDELRDLLAYLLKRQ
ncbi:MAG: c-type cytochrome [Planctomycetaceae bacterium]|nr:c-type cytochrome [Planctomycetaceae bacterium]